MYLMHTKPDICFAMSTLSQFMFEPRHIHWVIAKHVLRYLHGTVAYGLRYTYSGGVTLHWYTDSNWEGSAVDRKCTSGYCFSMGSAMISWSSWKQSTMVLSTTESKYIATCSACQEAMWLRKLLAGLFGEVLEKTIVHCHN